MSGGYGQAVPALYKHYAVNEKGVVLFGLHSRIAREIFLIEELNKK